MAKKSVKKNNKAKAKKAPKKAVKKSKPVAKKKIKKIASKKNTPKKVVKKSKAVAKKTVKKVASKKPTPKKTVKIIAKKTNPAPKAAKPVAAKVAPAKSIAKPQQPMVKASTPAPTPKPQRKPALSQFSQPVKLSEIPDYKPEAPAIQKKDVVKPAKGKQKEDTRNRYSEKELTEFKGIILEKLDQAKKDYELLKNTLCHTDDHGTDDTSPTFKMLEDGSDVLTREETAQLALRQEKFIQNLQNALIRIENKTYGICRVTGKLIPKERLRRVPHATLSIDAKLEQQYNG
jgi:RNA polymerase-binding transcription factor DksA